MAGDQSSGAGPASGAGPVPSVRADIWIWAVRLAKSRSAASTAIKGGHVKVNGERVKPSHAVKPGDEIRVRQGDRERIVEISKIIFKRVGAPLAAECYADHSPPPPAREYVAPAAVRERGAGRPTKRDRRQMERLFGHR